MPRHGGSQRAEREPESSALVITGIDVTGTKFQEESQTIDVSETGIAFYMKTSVWMDAHLVERVDDALGDRIGPAPGAQRRLAASVDRVFESDAVGLLRDVRDCY